MALSADSNRTYSIVGINQLPVKATSVIYKGSAVGITAGYARALTAGDKFGGFALEAQTGGSTDGANYVNVQSQGIIELSVSSLAVTDYGADVYASDDGTFTLSSNNGANSLVGKVYRFVSTGVGKVSFDVTRNP